MGCLYERGDVAVGDPDVAANATETDSALRDETSDEPRRGAQPLCDLVDVEKDALGGRVVARLM